MSSLLDAFFNDLQEKYAPRPEAEWVAGYRREFDLAHYPRKVTLVVKRYDRSLNQSKVVGFPRTQEEHGWLRRFHGLYSPARLRVLG